MRAVHHVAASYHNRCGPDGVAVLTFDQPGSTRGIEFPLYDAIKLETEAFMRLAGADESKRLIAEFFASRKK